ncbi:MAG: NADH-quinone oxidoreductase subunit NuoK, partial [Actinomycetota bacterium]|nr:NADH-quinone oxidoreductase subunit NuoK [Actinomycetota bacterium]
ALRGRVRPAARRPHRRHRRGPAGLGIAMLLNQFLLLSAVLFSIGVYGVLARRNGVLVLMSIELILNAVNINLVAFGAFRATVGGEVFALFVIAVAAAEVGVGLAMVLLLYRSRRSIDLTAIDQLRG